MDIERKNKSKNLIRLSNASALKNISKELTETPRVITITVNDAKKFYQGPTFDSADEAEMSYNNEGYRNTHENYFQLSDFENELSETHLACYNFDPMLVMPRIQTKTGIKTRTFNDWCPIF